MTKPFASLPGAPLQLDDLYYPYAQNVRSNVFDRIDEYFMDLVQWFSSNSLQQAFYVTSTGLGLEAGHARKQGLFLNRASPTSGDSYELVFDSIRGKRENPRSVIDGIVYDMYYKDDKYADFSSRHYPGYYCTQRHHHKFVRVKVRSQDYLDILRRNDSMYLFFDEASLGGLLPRIQTSPRAVANWLIDQHGDRLRSDSCLSYLGQMKGRHDLPTAYEAGARGDGAVLANFCHSTATKLLEWDIGLNWPSVRFGSWCLERNIVMSRVSVDVVVKVVTGGWLGSSEESGRATLWNVVEFKCGS